MIFRQAAVLVQVIGIGYAEATFSGGPFPSAVFTPGTHARRPSITAVSLSRTAAASFSNMSTEFADMGPAIRRNAGSGVPASRWACSQVERARRNDKPLTIAGVESAADPVNNVPSRGLDKPTLVRVFPALREPTSCMPGG